MKRISLPWTTVFGFTTAGNKKFIPATPWLNAASVKRLRAAFELISSQTNISVTFAYQTANVENAPDAAVDVGVALTADGMSYGTMTDISANTNSKQLVRLGFNVQNTAGATLVLGRCGGIVDYDDT